MAKQYDLDSKEDISVRLNRCEELILQRTPKAKCWEIYKVEFSGLGKRTMENDLTEARKRVRARLEEEAETQFSTAVAAREDIIYRARQKDDLALTLRAEQDMAELMGLYKQENKQPVTISFDFGDLPEAHSDDEAVHPDDIKDYEAAIEESEE